MADDLLGLTELLQINDANLADINVTDLLDEAPLLAALPATISSNGTQHKYLKQTGAPVVGFRAINTGRAHDHSVDTAVTINLKYLDATSKVDVAYANGYQGGREAAIARETRRHLRAAFFEAEKQYVNGTGNNADGFNGLADTLNFSNAMTINAGGTSASAATSVYMIRAGENDVISVAQREIEMMDTVTIEAEDGSGNPFAAYMTPVGAWLGLQVGSAYSLGRICNITAQSGKGVDRSPAG
jgi:hypothetical protein